VAAVENRLDVLNDSVTIADAFAEAAIRRLPPRALREAILNGVVHRDWMQTDAVSITWIEADSALQVVSPGGFVGGISAGNALTRRYARYPALADLFRALRLVDKQGMGVDRMVREMVTLGHLPPVLVEEPGPRVRVRLTGGVPVVPVMNLMERIRPTVRRRDVRIALVVYTLLHQPFVTPATLVDVLQRPEAECAEAIDVAAECLVGDKPLLRPHRDVWLLSKAALAVVLGSGSARLEQLRRRGALAYWRPDSAADVARAWFASHDRITSGDYAAITGFTQPGALRQLDRLTVEGLLHRGDDLGRNAHFTPEPGLMKRA
jgi:ATP-dependent DNA helicase RecG